MNIIAGIGYAIVIFILSAIMWNIPLNWYLSNRDIKKYGEIRPAVGGMPILLRVVGIIISLVVSQILGNITNNQEASQIGFFIRAALYFIIRY